MKRVVVGRDIFRLSDTIPWVPADRYELVRDFDVDRLIIRIREGVITLIDRKDCYEL